MNKEHFTWQRAIQHKPFLVHLLIAILLLVSLISIVPYFFNLIILHKPGITLYDPVLAAFRVKDYSGLIFILIYGALFFTIAANFNKPAVIIIGIEVYAVVNLIRLLAMYVYTLEAPHGIIPLVDPIIERIVYGNTVFVKDLFFSGHVATLTVLVLIEPRRAFRMVKVLITILVALLILIQHVHYTIDVAIAPPVTYVVYRAFKIIHNRHFSDLIPSQKGDEKLT